MPVYILISAIVAALFTTAWALVSSRHPSYLVQTRAVSSLIIALGVLTVLSQLAVFGCLVYGVYQATKDPIITVFVFIVGALFGTLMFLKEQAERRIGNGSRKG